MDEASERSRKKAVLVLEVEWSGLGKCDPLGARFRRNLDAFWTPAEYLEFFCV